MSLVIYSMDAHEGSRARVFLDGQEITGRCRAVQAFDDGTIVALCYKTLNGAYVVNGDDVVMEELRGNGHVIPLAVPLPPVEEETAELYESLPTDQLVRLQTAFQMDQDLCASTADRAIAFADSRLKLIADVLAKRAPQ